MAPNPEQDLDAPPKKRQKQVDGSKAAPKPTATEERGAFPWPDTAHPPKPLAADAETGVPSQTDLPIKDLVSLVPTDTHPEDKLELKTSHLDSPHQEAAHAAVATSVSAHSQTASSAKIVDLPPPTNDITTEASSPHHYLHAPRLPSMYPVLIPLLPDATLSESLQGRLVLEYPTIYVLADQPEKLPHKYVTEEMFFKKLQEEGYRERLEAKLTGQEEGELVKEVPLENESVDERKLEEVLDRDLVSLRE